MAQKQLERSLGLPMVVAVSISAMLGGAIFVLPGFVVAKTGSSAWLAYVLAGICVLPAALSKSELATAMPSSGGTYVYFERTFGPLVGTITGLGLWMSLVLKSSFALVGFEAYLEVLTHASIQSTALIFLVVIVALNVMGILKVARVQALIIVVALGSLLTLFLLGLPAYEPAYLDPFLSHGNKGLFAATAFVFVSYAGVTKIAAIAEEVRDPERNIPLGMILSLGLMMLVYGGIMFILVGNIPADSLQNDLRPIYTLGHKLAGAPAGIWFAIVGVVTMAGMANAGLLAASRFPFAMSRDSLAPHVFSHVHSRFKTPATCIVSTGIIMALIILLLDIEGIVKLASAFKILIFTAVNVCVIILRTTRVQWYKPHFQSPLYPWLQIFGIVTGLALLILLGMAVLAAIASIIVFGSLLFFIYGRSRTERQGVIRLYGRRVSAFLRFGKKPPVHRRSSMENIHRFFPGLRSMQQQEEADEPAPVVVALIGQERSPEMLVEIGAALADGDRVAVVHVSELPEQTALDALPATEALIESLHRRITTLSQQEGYLVDLRAIATHDLLQTVYNLHLHHKSQWLVMQSGSTLSRGVFLYNPVNWIMRHVPCNLALLHDVGVRYIQKIIVQYEPGPDAVLVAMTADQLARIYNTDLTFVYFCDESDSDQEVRLRVEELDRLRVTCKAKSSVMLRSEKNHIQTLLELSTAYDLLVTGSPPHPRWQNLFFGMARDRLVEEAACSVLRIRRPRRLR